MVESEYAEICKICSGESVETFSATILRRHKVRYFRCINCGFVQTEEPYWLDEAYDAAITGTDIGLVNRNIMLARITQSVISICFNPSGIFLDYGGGYGLMVRLMRDAGFDFFWSDKFCDNIFARGYEGTPGMKYDLVTAFEVFEHMRNPVEELGGLLDFSDNILFTTNLLPLPCPDPGQWWYYGLDHGQHISFYSIASLKTLASRLKLNYYTNGSSVHLFTAKKMLPFKFRMASTYSVSLLVSLLFKRKSLLLSDFAGTTTLTERYKHG